MVVRTCVVPTSTSHAFLSSDSLVWTLVDDSGRQYPSLSGSGRGRPRPVYDAGRGPQRIGTCLVSRMLFAVPPPAAPVAVRCAISGDAPSTWDVFLDPLEAGDHPVLTSD